MSLTDTVNTTRLPYQSPVELSVAVSRLLWPTAASPLLPKVIILAPENLFPYSFMASSLIHDPVMGNKLLMPTDELPALTFEEIRRINPQGAAGLPPVILVGPFEENVIQGVEDAGYPVLHIMGKNVFATAASVARLRREIPPASPDGPVSLMLVSADNPFDGMAVSYYAAHSGVPVLFTYPDRLPRATAAVLEEMKDKYVYIIGTRRTIAQNVISEVNAIIEKPARHIAGRNPYVTAIEFAAYHDPESGFGWNRNRKGRGDAFSYACIDCWELATAGSSLAHRGKHTPLLLVEDNRLTAPVQDYLDLLRPPHRVPPRPPFMHGFILGDETIISRKLQAEIDAHMQMAPPEAEPLEPKPKK